MFSKNLLVEPSPQAIPVEFDSKINLKPVIDKDMELKVVAIITKDQLFFILLDET